MIKKMYFKHSKIKNSLLLFIVSSAILCSNPLGAKTNSVIVDSKMTLDEALAGTTAPDSIMQRQVLLDVEYYSFDNKLHRGQVVVDKDLENDIVEIFQLIKQTKFPVNKAVPIVKYNWSDSASMVDNNTSAFNYRLVSGTNRVSEHAYGRAVDINPVQNPYVSRTKQIIPAGAKRNPKARGTLTENSVITKKFIEKGWDWGGHFIPIKDWHHFAKPKK